MMLRGLKPPVVGSVRDKILTRMYLMEQLRLNDMVSTVCSFLLLAARPDEKMVKGAEMVFEEHKKSAAFMRWTNEEREKVTERKRTDDDILERVKRLGRK